MEYTTIQKNISDSPRKLRLVADMVRKMRPEEAVEMLSFTSKAAATSLAKAIKTAMANAQGKDGLGFKKIEINEGSKLKRYRVGTAGRGRGRPYKRRLAHIKIVLTDEVVAQETSNKRQGTSKKTARTDVISNELSEKSQDDKEESSVESPESSKDSKEEVVEGGVVEETK